MDRILIDICKQLNGIRVEIATLTKAIKELKERDDPGLDEEAKEWGDISKIDGFYGNVTEIVNKEELE